MALAKANVENHWMKELLQVARHQTQPKYRIVEDYLRGQLADGHFPVDALLPTEEVLRTRFGVSRATVRAALNNLQADGMIARTPAIGSRVLAPRQRKAFQTGWNSVEDLLQHTKVVQLHVQSIEELVLDPALAEEIGFGSGRGVVKVQGVRWNKDDTNAPLCFVEIFFDALYSGIVDQIRPANRPIADLIEDRYQVRIEHIRQEISAGELPPEIAGALFATEKGPALIIKRWYSDRDNQMFQMTRSQYPAERFRYVVEFGRSHN
ncbi:GntR family transcriptional regulator [Mesorhizobium sp. M0199]|uniref:GntR family transcriptional regulator n=1 Tax=Mesorhizobium sp. M0199 TaxID=2956911 RepID=UPI0033369991